MTLPPASLASVTGGAAQPAESAAVTLAPTGAALGVKAIAVATGTHDVDELRRHVPDYVFPDLSDWGAAYEAILA